MTAEFTEFHEELGIDLYAASNVAFFEFPWTPMVRGQAIDRCHRIGQKNAVTGWELATPGTVDDDLQAILEEKAGIAAQAIDGRAAEEVEGASEGAVATAVMQRMMARAA